MAVRERWSKTSPIRWSTPQCIDLILATVAAERRIEACYLFGSRATGDATPDSDIDVAIYTDCRFAGEDLLELGADITRRLQSDRVHLVWLNRADPVVAFAVLRDGTLLHYRDADRLNDIERRLTLLYRDHMLYLQRRRSRRSGLPA
jgi:hypothetical protein